MWTRSISALELISDTFLPVNETAQFAVPRIFRRGPGIPREIQTVDFATPVTLPSNAFPAAVTLCPSGGFYVTLRLPNDEEQSALTLLRDKRILVHPGYFYDIAPNHLVMTFIQDPASLRTSLRSNRRACLWARQ